MRSRLLSRFYRTDCIFQQEWFRSAIYNITAQNAPRRCYQVSMDTQAKESGRRVPISDDEFRLTCQFLDKVIENEKLDHRQQKRIQRSRTDGHLRKTLNVLRSMGMYWIDIRRILAKHPQNTFSRDPDVMVKSWEWFARELKFGPYHLRSIFAKNPKLFFCAPEFDVFPIFHSLARELRLSKSQFRRMIWQEPTFLDSGVHGINQMVSDLLDLGLYVEGVVRIVRRTPRILKMDFKTDINPKFAFLMTEMGYSIKKVCLRLLVRSPELFADGTVERMRAVFEWLRSKRIKLYDIEILVQRYPTLLNKAVSGLETKWDFCERVLGRNAKAILKQPSILGNCSFEDRILMRTAFWDSVGVDYTRRKLGGLVKTSDDFFVQYSTSTMENFELFKKWWVRLTPTEKLEAFNTRTYFGRTVGIDKEIYVGPPEKVLAESQWVTDPGNLGDLERCLGVETPINFHELQDYAALAVDKRNETFRVHRMLYWFEQRYFPHSLGGFKRYM